MKKIVLAAFAAAVAVPAAAAPGDTDSDFGTAEAEIVAPITITHVTGAALNFGIMTAGTGGSVTVDPVAGTAVPSNAEVVLIDTTGVSVDEFDVTGDPNRAFDIVTGSATLTGSNGGSMTATTSASVSSDSLDGNGLASFTVGGTLTVGSGQTPGTYSGPYTATATYQ